MLPDALDPGALRAEVMKLLQNRTEGSDGERDRRLHLAGRRLLFSSPCTLLARSTKDGKSRVRVLLRCRVSSGRVGNRVLMKKEDWKTFPGAWWCNYNVWVPCMHAEAVVRRGTHVTRAKSRESEKENSLQEFVN